MADNTVINQGSGGDTIATDELSTLNGGAVSGVKAQRAKVGFGSDGALRDVDSANPLPASDATAQGKLDTLHSDVGSVGSSPPSLDTGASGLLGWLRKIYGALAGTLTTSDSTAQGTLSSILTKLTTTASSFLAVRLTDGASYLGSTAQRLHVDDGGSSLSVDDNGGSLSVDDGGGSLTVDLPSAATSTIAEAQASVATTAAQLRAAKAGRVWLSIQNLGSTDCYWGSTNANAASTVGEKIPAGGRVVFETLANGVCEFTGAVSLSTASGSTTVAYKEVG